MRLMCTLIKGTQHARLNVAQSRGGRLWHYALHGIHPRLHKFPTAQAAVRRARRMQLAAGMEAGWESPLAATTLMSALAAAGVALLLRNLVQYLSRSALLLRLPSPAEGRGSLLGHVKPMKSISNHKQLLEWSEDLGGLFCIRLLWARVVVVSSPELAHAVLREQPGADKHMQTYRVFDSLFSDAGHPSLFSAHTKSPGWTLVRKGVAPAFNPRALRQGFPHVLSAAQEAAALLSAAAAAGTSAGRSDPIDVDELLMRKSLDVLGRVGFEVDFGALRRARLPGNSPSASTGSLDGSADLVFTLNEALLELNDRWANPLRSLLFFLPSLRRRMALWAEFRRRMRQLLATIKARGPPSDDDQSIAAQLMRLRDPATGLPLPDDLLLPEVAAFFIAGMDTTAHTMAWTLYLLCQHPEAEARLCQELAGLGLLATPDQPHPRDLQWADLASLPYLSACIKESMRLMPVAAQGTAAEFPHDIQLGGYTIPAHTAVWVHFYSLHRSSKQWERAHAFEPERWLEPGAEYAVAACPASGQADASATEALQQHHMQHAHGAGSAYASIASPAQPSSPASVAACPTTSGRSAAVLAAGDSKRHTSGSSAKPLRFMPFSVGPRDCVGQSLARVNYTATLATLLGRFSFELAEEVHGTQPPRDVVRLTLQPEGGIWVHVRPRAGTPEVG